MGVQAASTDTELAFAQSVLREQGESLARLADGLSEDFPKAVGLLCDCAQNGGTVLVSGLGKSGHIGAKISATLASLGIPSYAVHPSEAAHGDLGRFTPDDTVICLSKSGETDEVVNLAAILKQDGLPIISISAPTDGGKSSLERLADVALLLPTAGESAQSPAPTLSTTATLALGDALALAAARRRRFTDADFAKRHPGGSLGGLLRPVTAVLRAKVDDGLPLIRDDRTVAEALAEAAKSGPRRSGALLLVDDAGALSGIFTDGDLRRLVVNHPDQMDAPIGGVMTKNPRTLGEDALVRDAVRMFREFRQDEIPVIDADGAPVGLLDVQDLIAQRLVKDHR